MKKYIFFLILIGYCVGMTAYASFIIPMYLTTKGGMGEKIGYVKADDTIYGVVFTPKLKGLSPGLHGFHIHAMPLCEHQGQMAGGHWDPNDTDSHRGPYQGGHLGDLPVLIVDAHGKATLPVLAPRLKLREISGHALMIHAKGDNYSDEPEKLGGGGERVACGVVPYH
jgi:Cu-Zn family superoxide dismutase